MTWQLLWDFLELRYEIIRQARVVQVSIFKQLAHDIKKVLQGTTSQTLHGRKDFWSATVEKRSLFTSVERRAVLSPHYIPCLFMKMLLHSSKPSSDRHYVLVLRSSREGPGLKPAQALGAGLTLGCWLWGQIWPKIRSLETVICSTRICLFLYVWVHRYAQSLSQVVILGVYLLRTWFDKHSTWNPANWTWFST